MGRDKRRRRFDDDQDEARLQALEAGYRKARKQATSRLEDFGDPRRKKKLSTIDYLKEIYEVDDTIEGIESNSTGD